MHSNAATLSSKDEPVASPLVFAIMRHSIHGVAILSNIIEGDLVARRNVVPPLVHELLSVGTVIDDG